MFSVEIILLGLALAIDAAVVTFAIGLLQKDLPHGSKVKRGGLLSFAFGLSQFLMLWLGSYCGYLFTYSSYGYYFQFSVSLIFIGLSVKCLIESFKMEEMAVTWGVFPLVIFALATSIDALAAGISLGTLPRAYLAGLEVGIITFVTCGAFYSLGQVFRSIPNRWLLRIAALIFAFLGWDIIWTLKAAFFRG